MGCPEPHLAFIAAGKKIVANKPIVVGPSIVNHLVCAAIDVSLGFFPISKKKTSGSFPSKTHVYDQFFGFGSGYLVTFRSKRLLWSKSYRFYLVQRILAVNAYSICSKIQHLACWSVIHTFLSRELTDTYLKSNDRTFKIKNGFTNSFLLLRIRTEHSIFIIDLSLNPFDRLVYRDFTYNKNIFSFTIISPPTTS